METCANKEVDQTKCSFLCGCVFTRETRHQTSRLFEKLRARAAILFFLYLELCAQFVYTY